MHFQDRHQKDGSHFIQMHHFDPTWQQLRPNLGPLGSNFGPTWLQHGATWPREQLRPKFKSTCTQNGGTWPAHYENVKTRVFTGTFRFFPR